MVFKKIAFGIMTYLFPLASYADRFGIFDDYEEYGRSGGGHNNLFGYLLLFAGAIAAYVYLLISYGEWRQRRSAQEKPSPIDDATHWMFTIIGYLIVAVFLCFPALLIVKWIGGAAVVRECWPWVYIPSLALLAYFRRT